MKKLLLRTLFVLLLALLTPLTSAHAAKLGLYPSSGDLKGGCLNKVDITINTEGENTTAVDAFLFYNPSEIEIIDQLSTGGVQLRPGALYQSYPGNIVGGGSIKLTAYNRSGFFNGRGTLASIYFKSKPGVEKTSIYFSFSPGSTTDSNVADKDSNDILNGAYGGTYTFKEVDVCYVDKVPPKVTKRYPDADAILAPLDSNIAIIITDDSSGVNIDTLTLTVDGTVYTKSGENQFTYSGYPNQYKIEIDPTEDFLPNTPVNVSITAEDMNKNAMSESYAFNKMMLIEECKVCGDICEEEEKVCPDGTLECDEEEKICPEKVCMVKEEKCKEEEKVCPDGSFLCKTEDKVCPEELCPEPPELECPKGEVCPKQIICPSVRPAAPEPPYYLRPLLISFLILFILSLIVNNRLWKRLRKEKAALKRCERGPARKHALRKREGKKAARKTSAKRRAKKK